MIFKNLYLLNTQNLFFNFKTIKCLSHTHTHIFHIFKLLILFFLFYLPAIVVKGQTERVYDCNNFNSFLNGKTLSTLKSISDSIYTDGTTHIRNDKINDLGEVNVVKRFLDKDRNTSYRLFKEIPSKINKNDIYRKYQQYYKGILVENGGFTVYRENGYVRPSNCNVAPAGSLSSYRSYIFSNIDVVTASKTTNRELENFLNVKNENIRKAELIISPNLTKDCEYRLVWKVDYVNGGSKSAWLDAKDGTILKEVSTDAHLLAPTELYGSPPNSLVWINDSNTGTPNERRLVLPGGGVTCYDHSAEDDFVELFDSKTFFENNSLIPVTTGNQWTISDAPAGVFQAFFVTEQTKTILESIDVYFDHISVASNFAKANGVAMVNFSTMENAFIGIGRDVDLNNASMATFDLIGHELGHILMSDFYELPLSTFPIRVMQEGIGDMIGTYVEAQFQGFVDWEWGDDVNTIRFLATPLSTCIDNTDNLENAHDYGNVISHWYFLSCTGDTNIPALGLKKPLLIVLEALSFLDGNSSWEDLAFYATMVAEQNYGRCSNEYLSVVRAWDRICIPHPDPYAINACEFTVSGPTNVCEENESLQLNASGGLASYYYRWQILQPECCYQNADGTMTNNTQEGGRGSLDINQFPAFNSYPQYATVRLTCTNCPSGIPYIIEHTVEIRDCNGDDNDSDGCRKKLSIDDTSIDLNKVENISIYNLMGKQLYYGSKTALENLTDYDNYLLLVSYFDEKGNHLKTQKHFTVNAYNN